ncbi:MAG: tripartite tricarboxylate transporter substrate-binding protein, partial [Synergistaceae bacterium]|nr:tripartite tricarboxylate transporter substrate-binding protein [Synergistaceae bacterium]
MKKRQLMVLMVLAVSLVFAGVLYAAENYPTKPVVLVYHSQAGSGGDIFLRNMGKAIEKVMGQPIIVENRTGGGGSNAWVYSKNSKPDGYTLLGISSSVIAGP